MYHVKTNEIKRVGQLRPDLRPKIPIYLSIVFAVPTTFQDTSDSSGSYPKLGNRQIMQVQARSELRKFWLKTVQWLLSQSRTKGL